MVSLPDCVASHPGWLSFKTRLEDLANRSNTLHASDFCTICEICDQNPATLYCDQDKAHLCATCDEAHHTSSKLLMRHVRLPIFHSPFQFGFCTDHKSDRFECVCLECGTLLCSLCLLVGSHAGKENHPIVSTIEAFRLSLALGDEAVRLLEDSNSLSGTFREIFFEKAHMLADLKRKHALVVQAESNHSVIQTSLDRELRGVLESLAKLRTKRLNFLNGIRRESLLLLTVVEWYESFLVHARLSLPASVWLHFFHRVNLDCSKLLLLNSVDGAQIKPVDSVRMYVETLPAWVTTRVEVAGFIEVFTGDASLTGVVGLEAAKKNLFEWIPAVVEEVNAEKGSVSPKQLREGRMSKRVNELLSKPQVASARLPGVPSLVSQDPVPLDNVKDFVFHTLAVLAESESQIGEWGAQVIAPVPEAPAQSSMESVVAQSALPPSSGAPSSSLPPSSVDRLRIVLSSGTTPFHNAVAVISAAPSGERQELVRVFCCLFQDGLDGGLEELIRAVCQEAVGTIESASFLVSGVSLLVPLTAAFLILLFPNDATFLDKELRELLARVGTNGDGAELAVDQFLAILASSQTLTFPDSIKFLLRTVFTACQTRFPQKISLGVLTGLFLARIVSPRLVWSAPKSSGDIQASAAVTLMTRYLHRMASAAAEGHSSLGRAGDATANSISQINGLLMRAVVNGDEPAHCPHLAGALTPRTAASRIERKVKDYGQSVVYY